MKIISIGNTQKKCKKCGCVMEYDLNDIHRKRVSTKTDTFGKQEYWNIEYIICPWCNKEIEINAHCTSNW